MSKFQELYTKIANRLIPNPERDPDMYNFLKEVKEKLIDEPTLEEVKREWGALGYKWIENKDSIDLLNESKDEIIVIDKENKRVAKTDGRVKIPLFINWQEHQLLTKTFKALGWFDE